MSCFSLCTVLDVEVERDFLLYGFYIYIFFFCEAASKMLRVTPPLPTLSSQPFTSGSAEAGPPSLEIDEELMMRSKNLSSTLQKSSKGLL